MITAEVYINLCIVFLTALFLVAFLWCFSTIKHGRGFKITKIKQDGTESLRYDFDLFKDILLKNLNFLFYMLLITNFIGFLLLDKWIFGRSFSLGSIAVIVVLLLVDTVKTYYTWVIDESEKKV